MAAQLTWQSFVDGALQNLQRGAYKLATGKDAPGTLEREANDLLARQYIDALKKQKTLTPDEEQAANLRFTQGLARIQSDENLRGAQGLVPLLLAARKGTAGVEDNSFTTRLGAATESRSRLQQEDANQQASLTRSNYQSYGNEILDRMGGLQKDMFDRAQNTRDSALNQIMDLSRRSTEADIDYRNQLLDFERQQNTGLRGFLGQLLPVAGTAAAIYASLR